MNEKLKFVLERIDSRHLASLWVFYRDYFESDEECIYFIYRALLNEPTNSEMLSNIFLGDSDDDTYDRLFIPRRMLNCVERMVSAARDMEQIRRGKDVFKIVFLVTCVETLQKLRGKDIGKKDMLFDFFETFTSTIDKEFIENRFAHDDENQIECITEEDSFKQFVGVINEYRNIAAHEGNYWDYCFNNSQDRDECPLQFNLKIDIESYSGNSAKKKEHCFFTKISYLEFENIFVRTCISFIREYVSKQEDTPHADT